MLRSFSWVALANLARQLSFLIVNAVLFERLSRSTFGATSLAFSYMTVFVGLGDFGVRQIGWREIARRPQDALKLTGPLLGAKAITIAAAVGLYFALMPWLWESAEHRLIYSLFGLGIALNASTFDFPFFGLSRVDLVAKYSIVGFSVYLTSILLLVNNDKRAWMVPALFACAMAILLALQIKWFWSSVGSFRPVFDLRAIRATFRASWPLGVAETLQRLSASYPLILTGLFLGSEGVGNYRIADIMFSFLAQFGHLLAAAGFTQLSHTYEHNRAELFSGLRHMFWPTAAGALAVGATFALFGPWALEFVFHDTAAETRAVVRILGFALIVAAPARLLKGLLASMNRQGSMLLVNTLTVLVGAAVGWIAILRIGLPGMALGVLAAELASLCALAAVYRGLGRDVSQPSL